MTGFGLVAAYRESSVRSDVARVVRLEREGEDVVVSPLLGPRHLCEACWLRRRAAALDVNALLGRRAHPTDLPALRACLAPHFRAGGEPTDPRQRDAVAHAVWRRRHAAGSAGRAHALTRVTVGGFAREEYVLPLPHCSPCWQSREGSDVSTRMLLGETAGIVNTLMSVPAAPGEPDFPHVVVARTTNVTLDPRREFGTGSSGKGSTLSQARASAVGEALERYAASFWPAEVRTAPASQVENAILPRQITGMPPVGGLVNDDEEQVVDWVQAAPLGEGPHAWVPAAAVYLTMPPSSGRVMGVPATTNGLATAHSLEEAVRAALAEVVERHVFFSVWYGLRRGSVLDGDDIPAVAPVVRSFGDHGLHVRLALLGQCLGNVVASASCWPQVPGPQRPGFVLGLGTDSTVSGAVRKAVLEVGQVYRGLTWALRGASCVERVQQLTAGATPRDAYEHGLLFAGRTPDRVPAPFGLGPPAEAGADDFDSTLGAPVFVDLTPPDVRRAGLSVVRVVVPGALPYHCGAASIPWQRLGVPARDDVADLLHPLS